jgi:hypothetical protein
VGAGHRGRRSCRDRLHHRAVHPDLAFTDPDVQQEAKIGILVESAAAALLALLVFRVLAYRGSLCYPEDVQASLPPLAQIADPD